MGKAKPKLNLENLARLREAIEKGGPDGFIMSTTRFRKSCGTAYCFEGRLQRLIGKGWFNHEMQDWLGVSDTTYLNLSKFVPESYFSWTKEKRLKWALRRLDQLKKNGYLRRLPISYTELPDGT